MEKRYLYSDCNLIDNHLLELKFVESFDEGWRSKYIDAATGEIWLKYQVNSEYHGGGQTILSLQPELNTKELIKIAIVSINDDEAYAAILKLVDNEKCKALEFREDLICEIRPHILNASQSQRKRLVKVITYSTLTSDLNRRDILGKEYKDVMADAAFYKGIALDAKSILKSLEL